MKRSDIVYLDVDTVETIHERELAAHGGTGGVLDRGLLESAVMGPRGGYHDSLAALAAAYLQGVAKNHAFVDGNKRTALRAAAAFLGANGFPLRLDRRWVEIVERVASGEISRATLESELTRAMGGDPVSVGD